MRVTPATLSTLTFDKRTPAMRVWETGVRFNKAAADVMRLPQTLVFDFDNKIIQEGKEGFRTLLYRGGFYINNRAFARYILEKLGADGRLFKISQGPDGYRMEPLPDNHFLKSRNP